MFYLSLRGLPPRISAIANREKENFCRRISLIPDDGKMEILKHLG